VVITTGNKPKEGPPRMGRWEGANLRGKSSAAPPGRIIGMMLTGGSRHRLISSQASGPEKREEKFPVNRSGTVAISKSDWSFSNSAISIVSLCNG
jgi:hypothetical protein